MFQPFRIAVIQNPFGQIMGVFLEDVLRRRQEGLQVIEDTLKLFMPELRRNGIDGECRVLKREKSDDETSNENDKKGWNNKRCTNRISTK